MPELPEVENVKLSLKGLGAVGQVFERVEFLRKNLRTPLRPEIARKLPGQRVMEIVRRAKFLLIETEDFILLNHLGMTGSWRRGATEGNDDRGKHDHVVLHFQSGFKLIYNDPRRFGLLELLPKAALAKNRWLKNLGVEPLESAFDAEFLFSRTRGRKAPLKSFIMDQRQVVGVGNIYASEALFRAGVKPLRPAGKLTREESGRLVQSVREILRQAIEAGGSTISDYRNSRGKEGSFQQRFSVYDRTKEPCLKCGTPIRSRFLAGRNTFWCPKCQR
jgi:formamidopyrimidine-DNA glycosylase